MASNPGYKPNEGKREEFRRYLEKTGVMDALTKVLVLLYEEPDKPDDALRFILNSLAKQMGCESIDDLKTQITDLQERIVQLESEQRPQSRAQQGSEVANEGSIDTEAEGEENIDTPVEPAPVEETAA